MGIVAEWLERGNGRLMVWACSGGWSGRRSGSGFGRQGAAGGRGNRIAAVRPETGEEIWRHELAEGLGSFRGVACGPATDDQEAHIYVRNVSKVVALTAGTGEPDPAFGDGGEAAVRIPYTGVPGATTTPWYWARTPSVPGSGTSRPT